MLNTLPALPSRSEAKFREYLISQNRMLSAILTKNSQTIKQLEDILKSCNSTESNPKSQVHPDFSKFSEIIDCSQHYNCKIALTQSFSVSICKSKYFKLTAQLVVDPGTEIIKNDRTNVSISLYSYDVVPRLITHTMQGKSIFRGKIDSILAYDLIEDKHLVHFKLQIKEVSSHFIGGLFYLALIPGKNLESKGIYIKPLIIGNVKVKAKEI